MIHGGRLARAPRWCATSLRVIGLRVETVRVEFAMERKEGWKRRRRGRGEVAKSQQLKALATSRLVRWCRVSGGEGSGMVARWWCDHSGPEQRFTVTTGEA
ncbi:unnamed protein product [Sphenostylis stenocarpa]|uniref:Uncharacterized protein n=1 Tax=Sphenostylis stenocarpa TaxID=92480 RepID=A0AA86SQ73_9FABA|nr:unnamed protein product [Sphenostylis stenocarpa]